LGRRIEEGNFWSTRNSPEILRRLTLRYKHSGGGRRRGGRRDLLTPPRGKKKKRRKMKHSKEE